MNLAFDTSVLIAISRGDKEVISKIEKLKMTGDVKAAIAFMSYFEFLYGLGNKAEKNKDKAVEFIEKFSVMHTTKSTARFLVKLKEKYELPLADLMIASQAMENRCILLTKDKDFEQIRELDKIII